MKIGNSSPHVEQFLLQSALNRRTRLQAIPSQPQKRANLAELEAETLCSANKGESLHVAIHVLSESARRSGGSREKRIAFVEANRVNAEANLLGNDTNLHDSLTPYWTLRPGV